MTLGFGPLQIVGWDKSAGTVYHKLDTTIIREMEVNITLCYVVVCIYSFQFVYKYLIQSAEVER